MLLQSVFGVDWVAWLLHMHDSFASSEVALVLMKQSLFSGGLGLRPGASGAVPYGQALLLRITHLTLLNHVIHWSLRRIAIFISRLGLRVALNLAHLRLMQPVWSTLHLRGHSVGLRIINDPVSGLRAHSSLLHLRSPLHRSIH